MDAKDVTRCGQSFHETRQLGLPITRLRQRLSAHDGDAHPRRTNCGDVVVLSGNFTGNASCPIHRSSAQCASNLGFDIRFTILYQAPQNPGFSPVPVNLQLLVP